MSNVIEINGLSCRYGSKFAVSEVSLSLIEGQIHGLVGANGAGKSTLIRTLLGFEVPEYGSSSLLGHNSQALTPDLRARIAVVSDDVALPAWMRLDHFVRMQSALYEKWDQQIFEKVLALFSVDSSNKLRSMSKGVRAGVALAAAIAKRPELLVLDEPTTGLDVVARQAVLDSLAWLRAEGGVTILFCTHHMDELERLADTISVLDSGCLVTTSTPDAMQESEGKALQDIMKDLFQREGSASASALWSEKEGESANV